MIYIKAPLWSFFYTLELMNVGKFLIATPSIIGDANFQRSVVLLVDQKESGTVGFILNKKLDYTLDDVMEELELAVSRLPGKMGEAFRMREMLGYSTEEITRELNISKANLWVLIHRAKQALSTELSENWDGVESFGQRLAA